MISHRSKRNGQGVEECPSCAGLGQVIGVSFSHDVFRCKSCGLFYLRKSVRTGVTKNNNYNIWKDYPVYPSSYKQQTNNKRYWSTPDNGTCSPAEFCGTPYSPTNIKIDKVIPGLPIGASGVTRVNWWAGKK